MMKARDRMRAALNVDAPDRCKPFLNVVPRLVVHLGCTLPHDLDRHLAQMESPQHFEGNQKVGHQKWSPGWDYNAGKIRPHDALCPLLVLRARNILENGLSDGLPGQRIQLTDTFISAFNCNTLFIPDRPFRSIGFIGRGLDKGPGPPLQKPRDLKI